MVVRSANNWYFCDYFGEDKNVKVRAVFDIEADREFINAFEKAIVNETFRSAEDFSRRFESFRDGYRQQNNGRSDASSGLEGDADAGVALSELQEGGLSDAGAGVGQGGGDLSHATVKSQYDGSTQPRIRFTRVGGGDVRFMFLGEKGAANLDRAEEATTRLDNLAVAREDQLFMEDALGVSASERENIPYGKEKPYNNERKANKAERNDIVSAIRGKKYTFVGTDVITIDENGHKVIYLIDHTDGKSFEEIYDGLSDKDKDRCVAGYGIRSKFSKDKLNDKKIKDIIRNIASDYGRSEERIREVLQNLGNGPANLSGIDIDAELKRSVNNDAVGDAGNRRQRIGWEGEGYDNANSEYSGSDRGEGEAKRSKAGRLAERREVEFMRGPSGTGYGWCSYTYDEDGKVVSRHVVLNEKVLNANTGVHEMGRCQGRRWKAFLLYLQSKDNKENKKKKWDIRKKTAWISCGIRWRRVCASRRH